MPSFARIVASRERLLLLRFTCKLCHCSWLATEQAAQEHPECPFCGSHEVRRKRS